MSRVTLEFVFNTKNKVLDKHKLRLSTNVLDCVICSKDWKNVEERIQNYENKMEMKNNSINVSINEN